MRTSVTESGGHFLHRYRKGQVLSLKERETKGTDGGDVVGSLHGGMRVACN